MEKESLKYYVAGACALFLLASLIFNLLGRLPYVFTAISFLLFFWVGVILAYFTQSKYDKKITLFIFVIVLLILSFFVQHEWPGSANDRSRISAINGLVQNNSFETGPENMHDKIYIDGKYYSDKPPVLSFLGSGWYWIIQKVAHWNGKDITYPDQVYFWLALFMIAIPSAAASALFYKLLGYTKLDYLHKCLLVFALIFGTLMFSYSGTINSHTVAASALLAGFYFVCSARFKESAGAAVASGFFFALAATIDLPSLIWLVIFGALTFVRKKYRFCGLYALGALMPLIFHVTLNYHITGSLIPGYLHADYYNWPGSPWNSLFASNEKRWDVFLWNILLGDHGLFVYTPIFVFSFAGIGLQLRRRTRFFSEACCVLIGIIILMAFYVMGNTTHDYGGWAYGFRHLISIIPFLVFFIACFFEEQNSIAWLLIFLLALFYSVYVAYVGTHYVWKIKPPPFFFKIPFKV